MRRSLLILFLAVLAGVTLTGGSYLISKRVCCDQMTKNSDDLEWLRQKFRLGDAEMQRVRQLHEGYLPKCQEMCLKIAAKKTELQLALDQSKGVTPEAEQKLSELAALRSQCQLQMLRHFYEVSQAMPPVEGARYLAEMKRLTLGFHENFENAMSPAPSSNLHGHNQH